ncbi:MAG: signal peptidase I [Gemmatimonadetes bacterium]|jgi:signal peptidase I|nr:signal peptidase I [Gemmatimonadota bacterium]
MKKRPQSNETGSTAEAEPAPDDAVPKIRRQKRGQSKKARKENALTEWLKSLGVAVLLFVVMRTFVLQTFVITSGSMENTLLVGDMLVANQAAIGARIPGTSWRTPGYSRPRRGEVWVFDPRHEVDMKLVKRLIGVPDDTLEMRGGTLFLNGEEQVEPYLNPIRGQDERSPDFEWQRDYLVEGVDRASYQPSRHHWGPIAIPEGYYFMLGDNRDSSYDSRYWGLLESWRLEGRVAFTYFSYNANSYRPFPVLREIRWDRVGRGID